MALDRAWHYSCAAMVWGHRRRNRGRRNEVAERGNGHLHRLRRVDEDEDVPPSDCMMIKTGSSVEDVYFA